MDHTKSLPLPIGFPIQIAQIIIGAGIAAIVFGFLWTIVTLPYSLMATADIVSSNGSTTLEYIVTFTGLMPILFGIACIAWGYVKSVEEREYGQILN